MDGLLFGNYMVFIFVLCLLHVAATVVDLSVRMASYYYTFTYAIIERSEEAYAMSSELDLKSLFHLRFSRILFLQITSSLISSEKSTNEQRNIISIRLNSISKKNGGIHR